MLILQSSLLLLQTSVRITKLYNTVGYVTIAKVICHINIGLVVTLTSGVLKILLC